MIEYTKKREPILERIIQLVISIPLLKIILKFTRSKKLPYVFTFLMFLTGILGSVLLINGNYLASSIMFLLSVALDKMDGTSARFIFGKDPELRGTLDFILGHIVGVTFLVSLLRVLIHIKAMLEVYALIVFMALFMVFLALQSTKFRLFAKYGLDEKKKFRVITLKGFYSKVWNLATKLGIKPFPTECDAFILLEVLLPVFGFKYTLTFIMLSNLAIFFEIFVLIFILNTTWRGSGLVDLHRH